MPSKIIPGHSAAGRISRMTSRSRKDAAPMGLNTTQVVIVSTASYPRLVPKARAKQAMMQLRSDEMLAKAGRIIALKSAELRGAVLELVEQTEEAARAGDWITVYETTH